jgi:glycosyltransferase involved in cell wall biosynthesis/CheY-like chemotaxis protein
MNLADSVVAGEQCVLCQQSESTYLFSRGQGRIVKCVGCELLRRVPPAPFEVHRSQFATQTSLIADHGASAAIHGGPAQGHSGPAHGHSGPAQGHGGPAQGYGGPAQGYGGPAEGHGGPAQGHGGPAQGHSGPAAGHGGPAQGHSGPAAGYGGPAAGHGGPSAEHGAATVDTDSAYHTELLACQHYIRCLKDVGLTAGKILYAGTSKNDVLSQLLEKEGYSVTPLHLDDPSAQLSEVAGYDCVMLSLTLERAVDPYRVLMRIRQSLKEDGLLFILSPNLDSKPAKFFGRRWTVWNSTVNHFFSRATLQLLLERCGFHEIIQLPDDRFFTFDHVRTQVAYLPDRFLRKALQNALSVVPKNFFKRQMHFESSAMIVLARKTMLSDKQKLSIVMPVYNEKGTFMESFSKIHQRAIDGIDGLDEVEIIIVESNSTDGSKELVQSVQSDRVKVVYEEKPQGKGHAVRTGLKHATGNICVIQDADLEYDVNDYDALVKPIIEFKRTFVLGTRHAGNWKIRKFAREPIMAFVLNFGHITFTTIINVFFGQNLTDPFTMYKVFRRECLYKLKFECNRFDFDHELLIKLVQKGYQPIEIPVNYKSRGFTEGKKVTVIRDPITWLIADFKYLFASPFEDDYKRIGRNIEEGG